MIGKMRLFCALGLVLAGCVSLLAQDLPKDPVGPPFTEDQLYLQLRYIQTIGESQIIEQVQKRGVDFRMNDARRKAFKKAGAGEALLTAIAKASEDRQKAPSSLAADTAPPEAEKPVVLPPPLDSAAVADLLDRARNRALSYTSGLPSFICVQQTKRHVDPTGRGAWQLQDVIQARLTYEKQKGESYQINTVNNQLVDKSYDALNGAVSTGEFGSLLLGIFEPETEAQFAWAKQAAIDGRPVEVYNYGVLQERSHWHITFNKVQTIVPGYRGRVWVDRATAQVMKLTMSAVNIPADFPVRTADTTLEYDYVDIAGLIFLLPKRATVLMSEGRVVTRNEIEFRLYRKFTTDTKITFDTPDKP